MVYELITKNILHQFGINKTYSGYDYIVHAIGLIFYDERFFSVITKVLYITIAENYNTSNVCVEKNIRNVINVIWYNLDKNKHLIKKYFGVAYVYKKPSNKEFLGLLYEYIRTYQIVDELLQTTKITCPISNKTCFAYTEIVDKLINLH